MSQGQTLRALVSKRLTAAAEDIFVLFERTIAAYEEELCRSKEENQRKQQLLDKVLTPRIELVTGNVQIPMSPGPSLNHEITETPQIKEEPEEQSVKQEEEQLPVSVLESSAVCVKTEESSLLQQRQTEHREETQGEDISSEPHFHSETEGQTEHSADTDNDDWKSQFIWSAVQMNTETDGDHCNQVQISDRTNKLSPLNKSSPETTVHNEVMSGAERKKHQCPFCQKNFFRKGVLQIHIRVHTGEKPYICLTCKKHFADPSALRKHKRIHTGEKPYSCAVCNQHFADQSNLIRHRRIHTGQKPHSCSICERAYTQKSDLYVHQRSHTGETPFSCAICAQTFARKDRLKTHMSTHFI